jgi:hypothetical protein
VPTVVHQKVERIQDRLTRRQLRVLVNAARAEQRLDRRRCLCSEEFAVRVGPFVGVADLQQQRPRRKERKGGTPAGWGA